MNVVESVLAALEESDANRTPKPLEEGHAPVELSDDNYHVFEPEPGRLTFIDGGNAELIGAASFSLQLLRFATVTYEGRERAEQEREEFYALATSDGDEYTVETFPSHFTVRCDVEDDSLSPAGERVSPARVCQLYRRLYELRLAERDGRVVVDGALIGSHAKEEQYLENLESVCGVAKTSDVVTRGGSLVAALLDKQGSWYYHPVYDGGTPVSFARLHAEANHVFRIDMDRFNMV
ncbi:MAG: hypothetical protein ABEI52_12240 [Halobacteriaceae archaeon]